MPNVETVASEIRNTLMKRMIATMPELRAVTASARMTVIRALRRCGYLSSYSHRGRYYSLREIAEFDAFGLWSVDDVRFSTFGNLLSTARHLVDDSLEGCTAGELEIVLGVEVKHSLLELTRRKELLREKIGGSFVYLSTDHRRRRQKIFREDRHAHSEVGMGFPVEVLPDEIKAGIVLFFSILNERQRRLYAGLEAAKLGHGGDRRIAELLGLDPHTVAKGRRQLFTPDVDGERVRLPGAGRKPVEKKRPQ